MLNIILITFISFIPIVFWGYIFSSMEEKSLNKKRFLVWIFAWALSVLPILYMDKIIEYIKILTIDFFAKATEISSFITSLEFSVSLAIFTTILVVISFWVSFIFIKKYEIIKDFFKNFLIFLFFILIIWSLFYILNVLWNNFWILNSNIDNQNNIYFWNTIFNTFKLIIFYYVLVAFIEETSKHFNFLGISILNIKKIEDWVLYAIFIALWFSFIENILYFYNLYLLDGISFELTKTYFFRSIFSIMVHVFASSVIAYFFTKAYLQYKTEKKFFPYLKTFFIWFSIAILLHFIFDFALTLWFGFVIIIYFVVWYLYVSSIFYRE